MRTARIGGEEVTYTRRFFGDNWLEGILQVITLGIGWLIWFAIVAPKGQTPAKQILGVYIHDYHTGERASAGKVWLREIVWKLGPTLILGAALSLAANSFNGFNFGGIYQIIGALWMFGDERQALWDKFAGTVVRYHPGGFRAPNEAVLEMVDGPRPDRRLQELELLKNRGLVTDDEYQQKRREIISQI